ncbi:MAG: hypothetical protein NUW23_07055 [Firmicutes bacterium]|nr:hypothetical protein [Bacillota bacterium]
MDLRKRLEVIARQAGASLFGVGPVSRFEGAPSGHHPSDWVSGAECVISIGMQIPPAIIAYERYLGNSPWIRGDLRKEVLLDHFYGQMGYDVINRKLDEIGLLLVLELEDQGFTSVSFPATYGDSQRNLHDRIPGRVGLVSHRHAAVRCGLGEFGLNSIVVTPAYGPRVRFTTVVTRAALEPSPLLRDKVCLGEACRMCIDNCGPGAITLMDQAAGDGVWLDPVSRTNQDLCRGHRRDMFCHGRCARVCPVGLRSELQWESK